MGAKYLARNVEALATSGRLVVIGLQGGRKAELDLGMLLRKRAAVIATSLRARPAAEKAPSSPPCASTSGRWSSPGGVRPIVHGALPAGGTPPTPTASWRPAAHIGKMLLTP